MEHELENEIKELKGYRKGMVHFILVHSYLVFFLAVIIGIMLDTLIDKQIFSGGVYQLIGVIFIVLSSMIVYWAQTSSFNYKKIVNKGESSSHFEFGPYKYLRSPTHFGLFMMTLGLSLIINSPFGAVLTLIAYIITKLFFLKKEEVLLEQKYGQAYIDYKKKVKNWV